MKCGASFYPSNSKDGCGTNRDHTTGKLLAYVLAPQEDEAFLKLKTFLQPFGITRFFTDGWQADQRHLDEHEHIIGKSNTQTIDLTAFDITDKD